MKSTIDSKIGVSARNINLVFQSETYRTNTWRDFFVKAIHRPMEVLLTEKDRLHILKDLNFKVQAGDRVGIIGVNGTGKTTLCRCIAGMYQPTSGELIVNGRLRAVFNTTVGIHPELTGRENADLLMQFIYPYEKDKKTILKEALEFSELGSFLDIPFKFYSNGMQARLCLSLVSAKPADILILDEVFEGADQFFREKIANRTIDIIKNSGIVFFVSHSAEQVKRVCNRVLLLDQGNLIFDGKVSHGLNYYSALSYK